MPEPTQNGRSQSVDRPRVYDEPRSPPLQERVTLAHVTARLPPIPPIRANPFARQLAHPHRPEAENQHLQDRDGERPTGPNQTDAILYEAKDLMRDLIQKAGQIEQLLRIIHYNLPPVGRTHHAPLPQAQPQRPDA